MASIEKFPHFYPTQLIFTGHFDLPSKKEGAECNLFAEDNYDIRTKIYEKIGLNDDLKVLTEVEFQKKHGSLNKKVRIPAVEEKNAGTFLTNSRHLKEENQMLLNILNDLNEEKVTPVRVGNYIYFVESTKEINQQIPTQNQFFEQISQRFAKIKNWVN